MLSSKKPVLVTGASGSLGTRLIEDLAAQGVPLVAQVRERSDTARIDALGIEKRVADFEGTFFPESLVRGVGAVIHNAAYVNFRRDRRDRFEAVNARAPARLFEAARAAGVERFVQVSSVVAVGALPRRNGAGAREGKAGARPPVDESHPFNLGHLDIPYIASKRKAEESLQALASGGGMELVIVDLSKIVSPSRDRNDLERARRLMGHGVLPCLSSRFNLVDIRDVSFGVIAALRQGRSGERYILGGVNTDLRELARAAGRHTGKRPALLPVPRFFLRSLAPVVAFLQGRGRRGKITFYPDLVRMLDYDWVYSSAKAARDLDYHPKTLERMVNHLLARPV